MPILAHTVRLLSSSCPHTPDRFHHGIKSLLYALVRKFEFGLVLPAEDTVWGIR